MEITTSRFGSLSVDPKDSIKVPKGLLGFENLREYYLVEPPQSAPFLWFQSSEDSTVAFPLIDPAYFFPEYRIEVDFRELGELKICDAKNLKVFILVVVPPGHPQDAAADLMGPIVLNAENRLAKQVVLSKSPYSTHHFLLRNGRPGIQQSPAFR
jgi:flagellar assembly factor FliW